MAIIVEGALLHAKLESEQNLQSIQRALSALFTPEVSQALPDRKIIEILALVHTLARETLQINSTVWHLLETGGASDVVCTWRSDQPVQH